MGELIDFRPERLWREVLGARIRELRRRRELTLAQTANRAGISPQYLSEVERGLKDPSSEIVAAIAGALDITVLELTTQTVVDLRSQSFSSRPAFHGPVALAA
jgi:transcriptional regulator with XRE-family HTH domain